MSNMDIGKLKVSEALPFLKEIAFETGLRINRAKEFRLIYTLFVLRHFQHIENC